MKKSERIFDTREETRAKSVHKIQSSWLFFGILFVILIANLSNRILHYVPDLVDSDLPFTGLEAWKHLKVLNAMGPKVTGTHANEVEAVNFIQKEIKKIQAKANQNQNISLDHQIVSGSYFLGFKPYGMIAAYRKVQNIVVRIEGETSNAIMLNCHFDSVPGSPGASDDAINCAIMLELLSIFSAKETKNRHTIILLFNGAEEISLRASHGFITQHKWAKDIRLFINLEAAGSGGKEYLFQTSPGHSWVLNHYKAIKSPLAQAGGEEIFQSGLIPSDTDFRIFRDFGNIPGLDFAYSAKGYRYHTKFDSIDFLSVGVLGRSGENILGLVDSIANSHELDDINKHSDDSSAVYFDFLGFFFVHYPKDVGAIINIVVVLSAITLPFLTLTSVKAHTKHVLKDTLLGFFSIIFGSGFSGLVCYLTAYFIDKTDHSMSWYRTTFLAPGIYSTLAIICHVFVQDIFNFSLGGESSLSLGLRTQAKLNGINLLWSVLTLTLTIFGYRAGYTFMIILLINFITSFAIYLSNLSNTVHKWIFVHLIGQFFIILWTSYFYNSIIELFIPITGRSGASKNPDALIAVLCSTLTVFICSYLIPLTQLLKSKVVTYLTLIGIFAVSLSLAISSDWGFPYQNESTGNPTIQRHYVVHTARHFFNFDGSERLSDSGYYFMQWDRHAKKTIDSVAMPQFPQHFSEMCNDEIYCGLPLFNSRSLMVGGQWLAGSSPKISNVATIDYQKKTLMGNNRMKFSISINSSSLSSIYLRPRGDFELHSWSFSDEIPQTFNKTYFISVANGIDKEKFSLDFVIESSSKGKELKDEPMVDVTLVSAVFDGQNSYTEEFKNLLKRFPDWAFAIDCIAAVTSYVL